MTFLATALVIAFGLCLAGLAVVIVVRPALAKRFLLSFASSARAHFTEQIARLVAGAGLIVAAPEMLYPDAFRVLGWLLLGTAAMLMLLPWRWHHRFGEWAIPMVIRYLDLYAVAAGGLGAFILYSVVRPLL